MSRIDRLNYLQSMPLDFKISFTIQRLNEFICKNEKQVYLSFSGGKDSSVLKHIVDSNFKGIVSVFCNTGLEYPEVIEFVKSFDNVEIIKPKLAFNKVIEKYGYPVVSKEQAQYIEQYRNAKSEKTKQYRLNGDTNGRFKISEKHKYLINAPFKISAKCCDVMKKAPFKEYEKNTGKKPIVGTLAEESLLRTQAWLQNGCNSFNTKRIISKPLSIWTNQDILEYIYINKLPIAKCYGKVIYDEYSKKYKTTLCERTGCMFCLFGLSKDPQRFERLKQTHPKQYKYMCEKMRMDKVLRYIQQKGESSLFDELYM